MAQQNVVPSVGLDGAIDCLKAHLITKGYTQIFGLDFGDTFSSIAKMASIWLWLWLLCAIGHFIS